MFKGLKCAILASLAAVLLFGSVAGTSAKDAPQPAPAAAPPTNAAVFKPNFIGDFPPEAIAAWDKVNDALLRHLTLTVDVEVNVEWKAIDGGYIGMGGSLGSQMDFPNAAFAGTWYPISLANQIAGTRLAPGPDVGVDMSSIVPWDFSGNPPQALKNGTNDYVTTLMHEILHGMGFSGTAAWTDGIGTLGDSDGVVDPDRKSLAERKFAHLSTTEAALRGSPFLCVLAPVSDQFAVPEKPLIFARATAAAHTSRQSTITATGLAVWDQFVVDGAGNLLTNEAVYANGSEDLGKALTSSDLFWNGAGGLTANSGKPVKLYAPAEWSGPSSYSHLDDATYDGGPDSILTSAGEKMPNIELGPRVIGMLGDMGWKMH
jgi:hypothetical protein